MFGLVARELSAGQRDEDLWIKAFALANGEENATRATYIRLRVEQLTSIEADAQARAAPGQRADIPHATGLPRKAPGVPDSPPLAASPWARLWARLIDLMIYVLLAGLLMTALGIGESIQHPLARAVADFAFGGALLVAYDAILLAQIGTTIGKAILGISVRTGDGKFPEFVPSLNRAVSVWFFGSALNMGFPVVPGIAWWHSYKALKRAGATSWDKRGGFDVTQSKSAAIRTAVGFHGIGSFDGWSSCPARCTRTPSKVCR